MSGIDLSRKNEVEINNLAQVFCLSSITHSLRAQGSECSTVSSSFFSFLVSNSVYISSFALCNVKKEWKAVNQLPISPLSAVSANLTPTLLKMKLKLIAFLGLLGHFLFSEMKLQNLVVEVVLFPLFLPFIA